MSLPKEEFTFVAPLTADTPPSADALETAVSVEPAPLGLVDESDGAIAYAPDLPPAAGEPTRKVSGSRFWACGALRCAAARGRETRS